MRRQVNQNGANAQEASSNKIETHFICDGIPTPLPNTALMFTNQTFDPNHLLHTANGNLLTAKIGVHTNTATSSITSPQPAVFDRLQQQDNVLLTNGFTQNIPQIHWQMTGSNGAKLVGTQIGSNQPEMTHQHAHHPYNTRTRKKR